MSSARLLAKLASLISPAGRLYTTALDSGSVLQVRTASSGFVNQTISSTSPIPLTNMSVTITPKFPNSKFIIQAMITGSWGYVVGTHILRNGVDIVAAHGSNNAGSATAGSTAVTTKYFSGEQPTVTGHCLTFPVLFEDTPNVATPVTYQIAVTTGWAGSLASPFYFNNRDSNDMLSASYMSVWEIAA